MSPLWTAVGICASLGTYEYTNERTHLQVDTFNALSSHRQSLSQQYAFVPSKRISWHGRRCRKRPLVTSCRFGANVEDLEQNLQQRPFVNLGELTEADRRYLLRDLLVDAQLLSPNTTSSTSSADTGSTASLSKQFDGGYRCQTLGRGFCNWVYKVDAVDTASDTDTSQSSLVVKVFSDLAKVRVEESMLGSIDIVASDNGVGPKVVHRGRNGIVMQHVEGHVLTEEDIHGTGAASATATMTSDVATFGDGKELCQAIAKQLARLHGTPLPRTLKANVTDNMLWHTLNAMLEFVGSNDPIPPSVLDRGWTYNRLVEEVRTLKGVLQPLHLPKVLFHGDFKPSNIIVPEPKARSSNSVDGIVLIDYELSGPGYRGYDFYKLFRTANASGQNHDNMVAFVEAYLCEASGSGSTGIISSDLVDAVLAEMKLFEPLTWLEAGIFFLFAAKGDPAEIEKWSTLAQDRLDNYDRCKVEFWTNVKDYKEKALAVRY
mmetsp:Transcript_39370/g.86408  ORF Transcript_39370/g.86408 Transcript_39370/m.86408 type:complete len:489 (-) Transcript_39370:156-1622(-)